MKKKSSAMALTLLLSLLLTMFASAAAEGADRAFTVENLFAVEYDGTYQKPKPVVLNGFGVVLSEGTDYTLTYADNRSAGTAAVTVTGRGDYGAVTVNGEKLPAVTATAQFEITPRELYIIVDSVTVRAGEQPKLGYTLVSGTLAGSDKLPTPSYRLYERTADTRGITVEFGADTGKNYRIHITDGVLTYAGTEEIAPEGSVTFGKLGAVTYNGKAQTPEPTLTAANGVALRKDVDYALSYSSNVNAGTAAVTITGKGGYAETLNTTLTFEIKPAPVTVKADNVRCRISSATDEFDYSITSGRVYGDDDIGDVTIKAVSRSGYSYGPVFDLKLAIKNRNPNYEITTKNGTMIFTDVDGGDGQHEYRTVRNGRLIVVEPTPAKTALSAPRTMTTASITNPYRDVRSGVWYEEPALYCRANGLLFGTSEDTFSAGGSVTRAQLVTALYRLNGSPHVYGETSFYDVPRGSWYEYAVTWAAQNGIVTGYSEYRFAPNDQITREQFCTILYRYAKANGFSVSQTARLGSYADQAKVSDYAREAVSWALGARVLTLRVTDEISPGLVANRAELALSLQRFAMTYLMR